MKLTEKIHYVGVNDRDKVRFEGLWPLTQGMAYNSYIVKGEKTALIDTVDNRYFPLFISKIKNVIGNGKIDYLVINHMEPDHSGSLGLLRSLYPDIRLVGNKKTLQMAEGFYLQSGETLTVAEGSELDLGGPRLKFFLTPMVHWPETMMTYELESQTLFSGDAFGCYGALNGGVTDEEIDIEPYFPEMIRYYANIVGKYGAQVQMAMKKLSETNIERICSTHGPVWTNAISRVLDIYNRLSLYEGETGACLIYGTMYGNTTAMAESVAEGLVSGGMKHFVMHKLGRTDESYLLADVFRYKGLLLGAPTYNNGIYPLMERLLTDMEHRSLKNRLVGVFGSFSWASQAVKRLQDFASLPGMKLVGQPVEMKQGFSKEIAEQCRELGRQMAQQLSAEDGEA
ncbi:MAG: FprA family A-type flavoprotein [Bacteroidaceae bacterium]|nr:FprA family A-type flavoprotein [Bacteroidaceae bacterium]